MSRGLTSRRAAVVRGFGRTVALVCLWIVLTGGDTSHPLVAALAILAAAATMIGVGLGPGPQLSFVGLLRFIPMFLAASLRGGVDVALRCFRRHGVDPALLRYQAELNGDIPNRVFAALISLVPGTLCAAAEGPRLCVHVIDRAVDPHEVLARLERRVGELFGEPR